MQPAMLHPIEFNMDNEVATALRQRPELAALNSKLESVRVRWHLATDQLKPRLNLVAEGYLAGLQGDSDVFGAVANQFDTGRPGYAAGLVYERPLRNRSATATLRQREFELSQVNSLIEEAMENIRAEVETAVRNVSSGTSRRNQPPDIAGSRYRRSGCHERSLGNVR